LVPSFAWFYSDNGALEVVLTVTWATLLLHSSQVNQARGRRKNGIIPQSYPWKMCALPFHE
jgi:hypothetical protein